MRPRQIAITVCAILAALGVAACGEFHNTITPQPGTTTHIPLELSGPPTGLMAGVYDAIALGYYRQADMHVYIAVPESDQDPLKLLHDYKTEVAVSSEPNVLLRRNQNVPVVSVGAIIQVPLSSVTVKLPVTHKATTCKRKQHCPAGTSRARRSATTTTSSRLADIWTPSGTVGTDGATANSNLAVPADAVKVLQSKDTPSYQGLVFAVRPASIVNNAPSIRRFLQTTARGYAAARQDPEQAIDNMVRLVPSLAPRRAVLLAQLKAFLPYMFPGIPTMGTAKGHRQPWGFMDTAEWNLFGNWLHTKKLINDPAAITDSNTNELLAGKGV